MGLGTASIGAGLRVLLDRRVRWLSDAGARQRDMARVQVRQLRGLLRRAAGTEFGREHGFAGLADLPDAEMVRAYRGAVPARDYEGFRERVRRMREGGERDVLWPGLVRHYAQTSGTTAGDKYIPVSREMLASNRRAALDIFASLARFGVSLPRVLSGKILFLGGSTDLTVNEHGIATGDLSGLVTPMIRWPISRIYLPGKDVALISDWPAKIEAMARACVEADVRMVSGMPSWMLVLFERVMELARERGKRVKTIRDVWPSFEVLVHGGVKYAPFEPRVRQAFSGSAGGADVPARLELYPASEGFIAMQDTRGDPGLRLLGDLGNFYEFIPLERVHDADPPSFTADAVEKGQRYVVCMSTCAGLWRYIIGDVVEFDTIPAGLDGRGGDGPARLRIVGRHRHFINAFGENLIVEHIENAVSAAARASGVVVGEFTAAPVYPSESPPARAGLELAIEIESKSVEVEAIARFADEFDRALKAQNVDYTTKRAASLGMAPPTITPLAPGAFHRWMRARGKLGGQHKCPRCANHREIIDAVRAVPGG
ncbi:MAG: GH3 auxin-responsive promoter family protein [Phycisphaerales bacterium]